MSEKKDLVVKMTINSTDFDNGLKNAKSGMKKFETSTLTAGKTLQTFLKSAIKGFGALGVAVSSAEIFKTFIKSTQTIGDKWNNAMVAAKESFQSFATSVMTGNTDIIKSLSASVSEAYKFAEALDALGSAKISNQYARLKYLNPLNQALVNAGDKSATPEQRQESIKQARNYYQQYAANAEIVRNTAMNEVVAWLRKEVPDFNFTSENAQGYIDNLYLNLINGIFDDATKRYREVTSKEFWKGNAIVKTQSERIKAGEAKMLGEGYTRNEIAMARLYSRMAETPDERLMQNLEAIKTYVDVEAELISLQRRINRAAGGEGNGPTTITGTGVESGLTVEQMNEMLKRQLEHGVFSPQAKIIPLEDFIEYEEIIEEDTDTLVDSITARREAMAAYAKQTTEAITAATALGSAFNAIGQAAGDNSLGKWANGLGDIISTIGSTVAALMALAGAETVEGIAEVFSKTPGLTFTKVAMAATAFAGIMSVIASAKSAFAGSFADGGIVGGNSYSGDKLWARVNSGEMILNRNQQAALANSGQVKFVIEGSQLKGVLDNYESLQNM